MFITWSTVLGESEYRTSPKVPRREVIFFGLSIIASQSFCAASSGVSVGKAL